jgi:hypothetical protein
MIEKGHEADDISDISSTEFYKVISKFWCAGMWLSVFLHIWNPVPKYTASRLRIQTHWHIINVFFISPYLTKCASKLILLDSVTSVQFHVPQLRYLFPGDRTILVTAAEWRQLGLHLTADLSHAVAQGMARTNTFMSAGHGYSSIKIIALRSSGSCVWCNKSAQKHKKPIRLSCAFL